MSRNASFAALTFWLFLAAVAAAEDRSIVPDLARLAAGDGWKISGRTAVPIEAEGKKGIYLDAKEGDGIAWLEGLDFSDGVIEVDLKGKDVFQRSFLGVAFRGVDAKTYDAVYFRPFNFKNPDPARRNHAVQYVSHPENTWQKLRTDHPEAFEKPVNPAPDPNGWFHARIVIARPRIEVFVNDAAAPSLVVQELSHRTGGWVGLFVGNASDGTFANLKIKPMK